MQLEMQRNIKKGIKTRIETYVSKKSRKIMRSEKNNYKRTLVHFMSFTNGVVYTLADEFTIEQLSTLTPDPHPSGEMVKVQSIWFCGTRGGSNAHYVSIVISHVLEKGPFLVCPESFDEVECDCMCG
jgi:hypothetical protein